MKVTFHRAVDMAADPVEAVHDVVATGCEKILTSGGAASVLEGAATVGRMVDAAAGRLSIIGAGGVSEDNAVAVLEVSVSFTVCWQACGDGIDCWLLSSLSCPGSSHRRFSIFIRGRW
jgi:copper homeostasis protein CutC